MVPGEAYRPPLPASGKELSFTLPLGPVPPADWQVEATIEVTAPRADAASPAVSVNGGAGAERSAEALENGNRLFTYSIPLGALTGQNKDTITVKADEAINVVRVEVRLHGGN